MPIWKINGVHKEWEKRGVHAPLFVRDFPCTKRGCMPLLLDKDKWLKELISFEFLFEFEEFKFK